MAITGSKRVIFENSYIEALATEFARTERLETITEICAQCSNLMDSVIRGRRFDITVPFPDLKNFLYASLPGWVSKWTPGEGHLYSYLQRCINNGCVSHVTKETAYRAKYVMTDVPLDSFHGVADHHRMTDANYDFEKKTIEKRVQTIMCRWKERRVQEAARYVIQAILDGKQNNRRGIIDILTAGYDMSLNMAKFLLDWALGSVRKSVLDIYDSPLSHIDVTKARARYSFVGDIFDLVGDQPTMAMLKVFAGRTIKFPTIRQISQNETIAETMKNASADPSSLDKVDETTRNDVLSVCGDVMVNGLNPNSLY